MPQTCPSCGSPTVRESGEARWRCTNRLACPGQRKAALQHFARRAAMDIEHLGPALVDQLVETGLVSDPADLYTLTLDQVAALERMAAKSAANLLKALQESRERPLDRLLSGLGIPLVGEVAARDLANRYGTLSGFASRDPNEEEQQLAAIHGIGPKIAESIAGALRDERFMVVVRKLLDLGIDPACAPESETGGPLAGRSFCVTGTLARPRNEIHEMIRRAGGTVHKIVRKGTAFLVAGDKVGRAKLEKAASFGTAVIDENTLLDMLRDGS